MYLVYVHKNATTKLGVNFTNDSVENEQSVIDSKL